MSKRKIGLTVLIMGLITSLVFHRVFADDMTVDSSKSQFCELTKNHYFNALQQFSDAAQGAASQLAVANISGLQTLQNLLTNAHTQVPSEVSDFPAVKGIWDGISNYPVAKKYNNYVTSLLQPLGQQENSMATQVNKWSSSSDNGGKSCRTKYQCDLGEAGKPNCANSD